MIRLREVWHWWRDGKRVSQKTALTPPGIYSMQILDVRIDHKGRLLYDAEMLCEETQ